MGDWTWILATRIGAWTTQAAVCHGRPELILPGSFPHSGRMTAYVAPSARVPSLREPNARMIPSRRAQVLEHGAHRRVAGFRAGLHPFDPGHFEQPRGQQLNRFPPGPLAAVLPPEHHHADLEHACGERLLWAGSGLDKSDKPASAFDGQIETPPPEFPGAFDPLAEAIGGRGAPILCSGTGMCGFILQGQPLPRVVGLLRNERSEPD
jgi:hypothetical protein